MHLGGSRVSQGVQWDRSADVVAVGVGIAGLAAAAASQGCSMLNLEKGREVGGAIPSSGEYWVLNKRF